MPVSASSRFWTPAGTATNMDSVSARWTEPAALTVRSGCAGTSVATTVTGTSWSMPLVAGSSTRRIAECAPALRGRDVTWTCAASPRRSETVAAAENVPSFPIHESRCCVAPLLPSSRVTETAYVVVEFGRWPPSSGRQRL